MILENKTYRYYIESINFIKGGITFIGLLVNKETKEITTDKVYDLYDIRKWEIHNVNISRTENWKEGSITIRQLNELEETSKTYEGRLEFSLDNEQHVYAFDNKATMLVIPDHEEKLIIGLMKITKDIDGGK